MVIVPFKPDLNCEGLNILSLYQLTMNDALDGCFDDIEPKNVLVAYVLYAFSDFPTMTVDDRVTIRFIFDAFSRRVVNNVQFLTLLSTFPSDITEAAEKLIQAIYQPAVLVRGSTASWTWTAEHTLVVLARWAVDGVYAPDLLPSRTIVSQRHRIRRIILELRKNRLLTDERMPSLAMQRFPPIVIAPLDQRTLRPYRSTQGMRCAKALRDAEIRYTMSEVRHKKTIISLQSQIQQTIPNTDEHPGELQIATHPPETEDNEIQEQQELGKVLLREFDTQAQTSSHGRRYSGTMLQISELLRATSRKTYQILRQILPLPSESTLFNHYASDIAGRKLALTSTDMLVGHLQKLIQTGAITKDPVTIGIDAFAFSTFTGSDARDGSLADREYSHAFVFLHLPLAGTQAPVAIHIEKKENGSYDDNIAAIFEMIKECYRQHNIRVWFKSTDGDRYLSQEHDAFFNQYVEPFRDDFTALMITLPEVLAEGVTMPIPDPLHFAKNIRGKLLDHYVALVDDEDLIPLVSREGLQRVLNLGDVLDDRSNLGRMRDVYVTKLFTLRNVTKLIEAENYAAAFLFLPYSCIFTVLYALNITNETRQFFAKLAYTCFNMMLYEAEELVASTPQIKHRFSKGVVAVTIAEPNFIKRMMHSCLALDVSMVFGPTLLRLDSLGTHLVENSIGVARSTANSTQYEKIISSFATAELRKEIARKHQITLRIAKRVNDGGAKVNTLSNAGVTHPTNWDPNDIVSIFLESCHHKLLPATRAELRKLLDEMREFIDKLSINELPETTEVANALIVQRNFSFGCKH